MAPLAYVAVPLSFDPTSAANRDSHGKIRPSLKGSVPFGRRLSVRDLMKCFGHKSCNVKNGGSALTVEYAEKRESMPDRQRRRSLTQVAMATVISGSMLGAFMAVGGIGSSVGGQLALAQSTTTCKPGNGFGDKNHCHFGPPGQTMTTTGTGTTTTGSTTTGTTTTMSTTTGTTTTETTTTESTTSSTSTQCKPGNGFGDKNHCHSGPPGQKKHH